MRTHRHLTLATWQAHYRQYLYFSTSKASKLRVFFKLTPLLFVERLELRRDVVFELCTSTSTASKLSTSLLFVERLELRLDVVEVSVALHSPGVVSICALVPVKQVF